MPSFKLLITHLCFMLQMPVRLYDSDGTLVMQGDSDGEQQDPLVCDPDFAELVQRAAVALAWYYIWVPVIACALGCVCLFLFDLDRKYDRIVKDLDEGKWKGTSEHKDL